jgi:hypothetical protein
MAAQPAARPAASHRNDSGRYQLGRRLAEGGAEGARILEDFRYEGPTWRGWVVGLLGIGALSWLVPYADFVMQSAYFSFNSFPMLPVLLVFVLVVAANGALYLGRSRLGLTKQDLVLAYCMTAVSFAIPGVQFWAFWSTGVTSPFHHARPENRWAELLHPYLTPGLFPADPADPYDPGPRPVEWFYTGLPPGRSIPWNAWIGPYARWMVVFAFMYGLWLGVAALLQRRWSDQERLPFPIPQVSSELLSGFGEPDSARRGILRQRLFLFGLALGFLVHVLNGLHSYHPNVPELPLVNWNLQNRYLTEPPWNQIGALHIHICPSVIGLTYLLSLEVAFSLWFFYWVQKLINLQFSQVYGLEVLNRAYYAQGSGGLLALVLFGLWAGRAELKRSLSQALGLTPPENRPGDLSPRAIWLLLVASFAGAVAWLNWAGVSLHWAALIVVLFVLVMTGMARLVAEAGAFAAQIFNFPVHLLTAVAPPALLGGQNYVMLTIWDRMFTADWFRICPMPNIMNSLHLARATGLRARAALAGMAVGLAVMFALSFFTFLSLIYTSGGASQSNWFLKDYPEPENRSTAGTMAAVESWEKRAAEAQGAEIPESETPPAARTDWGRLLWLGVGFVTIGGFSIARGSVFWWPHPAGYVLWMASTIDRLWFSFFLGWALKWGVSKYGGMRFYSEMRRLFIGMVVGESFAALFWALTAILMDHRMGYLVKMG